MHSIHCAVSLNPALAPCPRSRALSAPEIVIPVCITLPPSSSPVRQGHIPEGEVQQYREQYAIVQQLTSMLETEPQNTPKLLHLMQLLQVDKSAS